MPRLPKKSTMKEVISRCQNYAYKLHQNGKYTVKEFVDLTKQLEKLKKAIDK